MQTGVRSRRVVLVAVCLGLFMVQVDTLALNLALPRIGLSLRAGIGALQWITDLYNLAYASLLLTGGLLGDRLGHKRVFISGVALFVAGSVASAAAQSVVPLLFGRLVQGIGAALEIPGTLAILRGTYTEPAERSRAMAVWAAVSGLAAAAGPALGGWLVAHAGWQSIFLLNIPVGAAAIWLTLRYVVETEPARGRRLDFAGQLLAALFLASVTYLIIEAPAGGIERPVSILCLLAAPSSAAFFLWREAHSTLSMVPLGMFRKREFTGSLAAAATMTFGMYGLLFLLGLYMEAILGLSSFVAGLVMLPSSAAFIITAPIAGRFVGSVGAGRLMTGGLLCIGVGLIFLTGVHATAAAAAPDGTMVRLLVVMALTGVGMGLNTGPAVSVAVGSVEQENAGIASGVVNLARMIGATLGVAVFGAMAARSTRGGGNHKPAPLAAIGHGAFIAGMHAAFWVGAIVLAAGAATALATVRHRVA